MIGRRLHRAAALASFGLAFLPLLLSGASAAGVKQGERCGGLIGIPCDAGLFCQFRTGTCGQFDIMGTCAALPRACERIARSVCGCDGKTYANDCIRQQSSVSMKNDGPCRL
jgi:hypothetical protein